MIRRFFLALILLAGCSTLPMTKLLMRNPLNVDPLVFRFAIATQKDVFTEILEETPVYLQFKYDLDKASEFMQESVKDRAFLSLPQRNGPRSLYQTREHPGHSGTQTGGRPRFKATSDAG